MEHRRQDAFRMSSKSLILSRSANRAPSCPKKTDVSDDLLGIKSPLKTALSLPEDAKSEQNFRPKKLTVRSTTKQPAPKTKAAKPAPKQKAKPYYIPMRRRWRPTEVDDALFGNAFPVIGPNGEQQKQCQSVTIVGRDTVICPKESRYRAAAASRQNLTNSTTKTNACGGSRRGGSEAGAAVLRKKGSVGAAPPSEIISHPKDAPSSPDNDTKSASHSPSFSSPASVRPLPTFQKKRSPLCNASLASTWWSSMLSNT